MTFVYDDGGRSEAGFRGTAGDCVVRAIAIATGIPYRTVYEDMAHLEIVAHDCGVQLSRPKGPDDGMLKAVWKPYIEALGWVWTPTMGIGTGCRVHLRDNELPRGRIIAKVTKHIVAVIDGVIHDTYDPSRGGTRCVYGYWSAP